MATHDAVNTESSLTLKGLYGCACGRAEGAGLIAKHRRDEARQAILEIADVRPCGTLKKGKVAQSRYGLSS